MTLACCCWGSSLFGCMRFMDTIWETVRKTGMLRKATVSCQPREGTPSTLASRGGNGEGCERNVARNEVEEMDSTDLTNF